MPSHIYLFWVVKKEAEVNILSKNGKLFIKWNQ
jgi:hypothetical protein